jgi:hypothetical protein
VKVHESGDYIFRSQSSIDTYGSIYANRFNPVNPSENLLSTDDDSGPDGQFKIDIHLDVNMTYVLVETTYHPGETGTFSITVFGRNKVDLKPLSKCMEIVFLAKHMKYVF